MSPSPLSSPCGRPRDARRRMDGILGGRPVCVHTSRVWSYQFFEACREARVGIDVKASHDKGL
ncbi:hypothetical protein L810_3861 [Burkholderia sp. AU4i]|nr:hypothetical protein L810_3861 [Burkholderia sp. AU4i]